MEKNLLQDLNDAQREAVLYTDGPQLVIAGAGSGKTRVLTYKIAHLLEMGYPPYSIMALTFTIKAANEMKERVAALVGADTAARLWMGTFHSIFSRILHANADCIGFRHDFTIYDTADSRSLIKSIIKELMLDDKLYKPAVVQSAISNAKNALITPGAYASNKELRELDNYQKRPMMYSIYNMYWNRCFRAGAMDFDDLLLYTNILFRDFPDVTDRYRSLFRYILVDEYQDTNFAQHLIVNRLCKDGCRLCVVGDDAQSIYSFRGANIGNILHLKDEYPGLRIDKLEQNYRSTRNIVDAANSLIGKNKEQIPKRVFSEKKRGSKVAVLTAYTDFEEAFMVANRIVEMHIAAACPYNGFAILYRTNAQSRVLEEALRKRNLPYRIYGGLSFYQRKEIKDAVAYLRLVINPNDEEAMKRVINYPARGIGDTTVAKVVSCAQTHNVGVWDVLSRPLDYALPVNAGTRAKLAQFSELIAGFIDEAQHKNVVELVELVIRRSGIMNDVFSSDTPENVSRQENISELLNSVQEFYSLHREEGDENVSLSDFLAEVSLLTDQDRGDEADEDKITLMTIHAAKGLEFRNVFITGLEENLFPSSMCKDDERKIEEERRLLYVAITRAEENCILSYAATRFRNGTTDTCAPSRFLKDLDARYVSLPAGSAVQPSAQPSVPRWNSGAFKDASRLRRLTDAPSYKRSNLVSPSRQESDAGVRHESLPTRAGELRVGTRIRHDRFGEGTVFSIEGTGDNSKIGVEFDHVGKKQLLLKFARFTIL